MILRDARGVDGTLADPDSDPVAERSAMDTACAETVEPPPGVRWCFHGRRNFYSKQPTTT